MLKVGLTGGIGSGKSTVAKIFEVLGIPVYYADDRAKFLMNNDASLQQQLIKHFGEETYKNGMLNRTYISTLVFNNPAKLELLNSIVHPITIADAAAWMQQQHTTYSIKEAALIFESGAQQNLDIIIGVTAAKELKIQRVMQRDNIDRKTILARMDKQINDGIKMHLCNYVINNDEEQLLIPQVIKVHETILKLA
jgi:dephospho-CoA kinase